MQYSATCKAETCVNFFLSTKKTVSASSRNLDA